MINENTNTKDDVHAKSEETIEAKTVADKGGMKTTKKQIGLSVATDPKDERKRLTIVTFAVMAGAASYIMMLFLAMPVSIHLIVNGNNGCDPAETNACFSPTSESQTKLTLALTLLRLMTFLMGTFVGTVSDVYGRKPLLILALAGYATTALCFLIGWATQLLGFFFAGAIILGLSSPITPHGVAYVSDISRPEHLAANLGVLQGIGYFVGLLLGAVVGLGISLATVGVQEETGSAGIEAYDKLFYASYGAGFILSFSSAVTMVFFLPESLHKDERKLKVDITKANPLGFLTMVTRQPYIFTLWLGAFFAWMAVGAGEAVTGGWWLRRYVMTNLTDFIIFIAALWGASAFGSVFMTRIYVKLVGVKGGLHLAAIATLLTGIALAFSDTYTASYSSVPVSFFAAPVYALILAVLMGQVETSENGALAGAFRSSEALGKLIGIVVFGNAFARHIENFRPDDSCIPADYDPVTNPFNTCECGVETCPDIRALPAIKFMPSNCTLGQLSPTFQGKPSKFVEPLEANSPFAIVPGGPYLTPFLNAVYGASERPEECRGSGMVKGTGGFETDTASLWCVGAPPSDFGLTEFPSPAITFDAGRHAFGLGCKGFNAAALFGGLYSNNNETVLSEEEAQRAFSLIPLTYVADNTQDIEDFEKICPRDDLNLCLLGPITSFPGLFPFLYLFVLGCVSYFFILLAEFCFVKHDQKFWKKMEEEEA